MKHQKIIGAVLTVCVLMVSLSGCKSVFVGNSIKKADLYALDIKTMTGTDSHILNPEQGDILQIHFETVEGSLHMEITDPNGVAIYQGNGSETTDFTLNAHMDGAYGISVEGKKAKGSIRIDVKKAPTAMRFAADGSAFYNNIQALPLLFK